MRVNRSDVVMALNHWESLMAIQMVADTEAESRRALIGFLTLMNYRGVEEAELDDASELAQLLARK